MDYLVKYTGSLMVPSSSGLGHLVLIQKIAGSTPAGITLIIWIYPFFVI